MRPHHACASYTTSGGQVLYKGKDDQRAEMRSELVSQISEEVQMIFQDPHVLPEPAREGQRHHRRGHDERPTRPVSQQGRAGRESVSRLCWKKWACCTELANRFPHEFSGGQRQRIGIARALAMEPEFLIAGRAHLRAGRVHSAHRCINLLSRLQKETGMTYLFIAHDLSVMRYISDRIAVIHKGDIVELADARRSW